LRVPVSDPVREYLRLQSDVDRAYARVMSNGWYVMGPEHDAFEKEFAEFLGVRHVLGVASGSDALELALRAVGCGPGHEVLTVANAGMYATLAALNVGAAPVFVDVDTGTLTMSPESVASALTPAVRAVVVTHLYGKAADVDGIRSALGGADVAIVEDCAQAHGASIHGRRAGSLGNVATFSFYPTKNLGAFGDGGALATDDEEIAQRIRLLRQYGWSARYHVTTPGGRNSRLDELQAAFLRVKLRSLDASSEERREIVRRYRSAVRGSMRIVHDPAPDFVAHLCVARHPDRERAMATLAEMGIGTAIHYPVADHQQALMRTVPWRTPGLAATEMAQREIVTLPCFTGMTDSEVDQVCEALAALD
jgi:dTDP-3-amino-2,3,6-trideoxy-4-keto-D-glucose/dTDP-3-amino-3,4,6-trideoxy-alpha-D-glucose/dTDP-2,6-dideoxy-D-kanosamine transaminase